MVRYISSFDRARDIHGILFMEQISTTKKENFYIYEMLYKLNLKLSLSK